jgi:chromosome segregation ATPase
MKQLTQTQLQQMIIHYKSELHKYQQKCRALETEPMAQLLTTIKSELSRVQTENETHAKEAKEWRSKYEFTSQELNEKLKTVKSMQTEYNRLQSELRIIKKALIKEKKMNYNNCSLAMHLESDIHSLKNTIKRLEDESTSLHINVAFICEDLRKEQIKTHFLEKSLLDTEISIFEAARKMLDQQKIEQLISNTRSEKEALMKKLESFNKVNTELRRQKSHTEQQLEKEREKVRLLEEIVHQERKQKSELAHALLSFRKKFEKMQSITRYKDNE